MQRNLLSILVLAIAMVSIVSCKTDKSGIAIPKDASFAIVVNTSSLTSKVSWQEIQQSEWFKKLYAEKTDSLSRRLLNDPANSGIDLKNELAFFVKKEGKGGYMAFEGSVKDAAAFEAFASKLNQDGKKPVKNGDVSVLTYNGKSLVAWTNNRFVYIMDAPVPNAGGRYLSSEESQPFTFSTDSLQKFAVQLFDLSGKNNLVNDDRFAAVRKEAGDLHYWVNAESYYNSMGGLLSILKMNVLFEGNAYGAALNFDNGKITLKSKAFYNKDMKALIEKYAGGKVSDAMINRIPSKNVVAVFAFKYPPQGLIDLLKLMGVDGMVNGFLGSEGFSTEEFVKANKGDVLISVSDFEIKPTEVTMTDPETGNPVTIQQNEMPNANILFATSVNDKPAFDKLFGILKTKVQQFSPAITSKVHFQLNNEWFTAGNSPEQVNGFLKGGNNQFPFTSRISGNVFGGYIDVQKILKNTAPAIADSSAKVAMDMSINMWQDVYMTSGGLKNGAFEGEAEINLVDKNTNSLKQLNKYLDAVSKQLNKDRHQYDDQAQLKYSDPAALSLAALEPALH